MDFFGLDIGSQKIKAVKLEQKADRFFLDAYGTVVSTTKGLASESEADLTHLAETIKKLYQEMKLKVKSVAVSLPQDKVFLRIVSFPVLTEDELQSALKWEAEQYVPIPLSDATLTHQIIGKTVEDGKEKMTVLLAAAPNQLIDKTLKVVEAVGLKTVTMEAEIIAVARALTSQDSGNVMIVDLGAKATDIAIVENSQVVFVHSLPTAGESLTRAISLALGMDIGRAEEYKKTYGLNQQNVDGKVGLVLEPVMKTVVEEIEKAIQYYQQKQKMLKRVVLVGGTAALPEVANYLAKKLNIEVQIGNPFSRMIDDKLVAKIPPVELPLFAVAVGLAMKKLD